jgi:uncharacterized protein (TIGR02145 family)
MKIIFKIILQLVWLVLTAGCDFQKKDSTDKSKNKSVETLPIGCIKIGNQKWAVKNLNVSKFLNGDNIPEAKTAEEWENAGKNEQAAWCYYDNDSTNGEKYGKLYNWFAVNDPRTLAPKDSHIPSDVEWTLLTDYLGGLSLAGNKMKSKEGWDEKGNGSNESGFSSLPSGERHRDGIYGSAGLLTSWWSSTAYDSKYAWDRYQYHFNGNINRGYVSKCGGFAVRCIYN